MIFCGLLLISHSPKCTPLYAWTRKPLAVLETVELIFGSKVGKGTALVSEDLAKYVGYGFIYPDRGLVLIVGTVRDFSKNRVYIRGYNIAREASLLLLNREMIKMIKTGGEKMSREIKKPSAERICRVVEKLCYIWRDGAYTLQSAESILDRIYQFTHLLSDCKNPHYDWREEFYRVEKKLEEG